MLPASKKYRIMAMSFPLSAECLDIRRVFIQVNEYATDSIILMAFVTLHDATEGYFNKKAGKFTAAGQVGRRAPPKFSRPVAPLAHDHLSRHGEQWRGQNITSGRFCI